jgi:hypothetical protein
VKPKETCPACGGRTWQQQTCRQCRGQGCDHCHNGYITVNGGTGYKN